MKPTQRREVLPLVLSGIAVNHVGYQDGPRVDPGRLVPTWARWPDLANHVACAGGFARVRSVRVQLTSFRVDEFG